MDRLSQSPTDPAFVQNPYPFYARARAAGDFVWWEDYALPVATTHRAADAVLRDRRMGRTPPPGREPPVTATTRAFYDVEAHSMLELEPPRHTRLRGLVLRAFTSRRVAAMAGEIEALAMDLARALPPTCDLIPAFANRLPVTVIARLLGVPEEMGDRLLAWSHDMVAMYQARRTEAEEAAAGIAAREFSEFIRGCVEARRKTRGADLISELIAAEEEGQRLSTDELVSTCILLLNAGHEATVHSLGNGVKAILETGLDPAWIASSGIVRLTEEILRHDPPLHLFTRWVYEPVEHFGHQFEPGDQVGVLLASAGRDPALCDTPDRFDPTRPETRHLAFGIGPHFCVGAPLARLEMQIALRVLLTEHPGLRLAEAPGYADLYHFHGLESLMVSF